MPHRVRIYLLDGFKSWTAWTWHQYDSNVVQEYGLNPSVSGSLFSCLYNTKRYSKSFKLSQKALKDLESRIIHTIYYLGLEETCNVLRDRFLDAGIIEGWFKEQKGRVNKRKTK